MKRGAQFDRGQAVAVANVARDVVVLAALAKALREMAGVKSC